MDGVLFNLEVATCFPGLTTLTMWLNGCMLLENLVVTVGDDSLANQPINYFGAAGEIQNVEASCIKNENRNE